VSQVIQPVELPSFLIDDKVFFNRIGFFLLIKVSFMFQSKSLSFVMYAKNVKTDPQKRSISIKKDLYQLKTPVSSKETYINHKRTTIAAQKAELLWLFFFEFHWSFLIDTGLF